MQFQKVYEIIDKAINKHSNDVTINGQYMYEITSEINHHLQNCSSLQYLNLNSCRLNNIENLTCFQIKELSLSDNLLNDFSVQFIKKFQNLKYLDLSGNQIQNILSFKFIENLPNLVSVQIEGNPCCQKEQNYPGIIFQMNKQIQSVDGFDSNGLAIDIDRSFDTEDFSYEEDKNDDFIEQEQDFENYEKFAENNQFFQAILQQNNQNKQTKI